MIMTKLCKVFTRGGSKPLGRMLQCKTMEDSYDLILNAEKIKFMQLPKM